MKKILLSLSVIVAVGAVVAGATGAFFSDTETSTGNTFTAGAIDLQIDNTSYAIDFNIPNFNGTPDGSLVASDHTTWKLTDLVAEKFFDFIDLKPGDYGEDTISIHVNNNDSWLCAAAQITADDDNSITEPEKEDGDDGIADNRNGELDEELNFVFWADDGDNVLELDEVSDIFLEGTLEQMGQAGQIALADVNGNIWEGTGPALGAKDYYIGKAWCYGTFGDFGTTAVNRDVAINDTPLDLDGPGISCNGANVDNQSQTDSVVGDLQFYAVQSRNNGSFSCLNPNDYTPVWP